MASDRDPDGYEVFKAAAEYFASSTAVFWVANGRSRASGVFIQHRGRFYVATAAHAICDIKKGEPLHLLGRGHVAVEPVKVKRLVGSHDPRIAAGDLSADSYDLGFIEMDDDVASQFTGVRWLSSESSSSIRMDVGCPAIIVGAPAEFDTVADGTPRVTAANLVAYGTSIITEPYESICLPRDQLPDPVRDIVLRFCPGKSLDLMTRATREPFDPAGMSGCGVYFPNYSSSGDWSPEKARLCGIQSAQTPHEGFLVVKRIEILFDLLEQSYEGADS